MLTLILIASLACTVTDGDTIRCGSERIRLLGIDAPEMRRCPPRRRCAPGDPRRSAETLRANLAAGPMRIHRHGTDRYGRTLARVTVNGRDLSCAQLEAEAAIYRPNWDTGLTVRRACPTIVANARTR